MWWANIQITLLLAFPWKVGKNRGEKPPRWWLWQPAFGSFCSLVCAFALPAGAKESFDCAAATSITRFLVLPADAESEGEESFGFNPQPLHTHLGNFCLLELWRQLDSQCRLYSLSGLTYCKHVLKCVM